jgi:hypothetical protein
MSRHTPGQWRHEGGTVDWYVIDAGDRGHVASVPKNRYTDNSRHEADVALIETVPELLEIARALTLATDEGDDAAQGTHYVDRTGRIRCKGSFLDLIERARAAVKKADPYR